MHLRDYTLRSRNICELHVFALQFVMLLEVTCSRRENIDNNSVIRENT